MIHEPENSRKIEDNLNSFYREIALSAGLNYNEKYGLHFVESGGKTWPDYILGSSENELKNLGDIAGLMRKGELPGFWIRNAESDRSFEFPANKQGIRKIFTWHGMFNYQDQEFSDISPTQFSNLVCNEIKTTEELRLWLEVINTELMSGKRIEAYIFQNLLNNRSFRLFQVLHGNKTVATLLFYIKEDVAGIYLVSVKTEYRRKGIGKWLTASAMYNLIREGIFTFVLHSTPVAYSLYRSLGFKEYCNFSIYWMVGKF